MKLYDELASWWPLLSPPAEYVEEAEVYASTMLAFGTQPAQTLLELGSGGGNNASYLKSRFTLTLVDISPGMLAVSRELNPECDHIEGDMRTVRLPREFDRVFVHDAIAYMTTADDVRQVIETAFLHCRSGGAALFAPDYLRETFQANSDQGGYDGEDRGLRYLEWTSDPDPADCTYVVDYAYMLKESDGTVRVEHERHVEGLFARSEWMHFLTDAGFEPHNIPIEHSELEPGSYEVFIGVKP